VFEPLRERLRAELPDELVEISVALRACAAELGFDVESMSAAAYEGWRISEDSRGAPTRQRITNAGDGSWSLGCARALGLPVAEPLWRRMYGPRRRYSDEELLGALRRFAAEVPAGEPPNSVAVSAMGGRIA
jgi:hypothetical protein